MVIDLFERIEDSRDQYDTNIEVTFVEIYCEIIRDLLSDDYPKTQTGGLNLLKTGPTTVTVAKATRKHPENVDELMTWVAMGQARRSTEKTECNNTSSRSHAVLQIAVQRRDKRSEIDMEKASITQTTSTATLSIIDLAGSERAAATANNGQRLKEGANINKSLLALSEVIGALCKGSQAKHVPYRNSRLTRMLEFSLGGNCRTVMLVCISSTSKDIEDTHNTLSWANQAKNVATKVSRNTLGQDVHAARYLQRIAELQQRVASLETQLNNGENAEVKRKRDAARRETEKAIEEMWDEVQDHIPPILEGAKTRARWDGAELEVFALQKAINDTDRSGLSVRERKAQTTFLESLVQQRNVAYSQNQLVRGACRVEVAQRELAQRAFNYASTRSFSDHIYPLDLELVSINVKLRQTELERSVLSAREEAYREVVQEQTEVSANAAAKYHQLVASLNAELDRLAAASSDIPDVQPILERLRSLGSTSESSLLSLFGHNAAQGRSMLPPPLQVTPAKGKGKVTDELSMSGAIRRPISAIKASPAVRRIVQSAKAALIPGSPKRSAFASPRRQTKRPAIATNKNFRWKDEAGEGELTKPTVLARPSTSSEDVSMSVSNDEDNWDDEDESDKEKSPTTSRFTLPPPVRLAPAPTAPQRRLSTMPLPSGGLDWRAARAMQGKNAGGGDLSTLHEDSEMPASGPARSLSLLGPPGRSAQVPSRQPLGGRHQVAAGSSSIMSTSTSRLFKQTQSSMAKKDPTEIPGPNNLASKARRISSLPILSPPNEAPRRVSTFGPVRDERHAFRRHDAPYSRPPPPTSTAPRDTSTTIVPPISDYFAPPPASTSATKQVFGGPLPATLNRRMSELNLAGSSAPPGLPRSIFPRPSMNHLNGIAGSSIPRLSPSSSRSHMVKPAGNTSMSTVTLAGVGSAPWR